MRTLALAAILVLAAGCGMIPDVKPRPCNACKGTKEQKCGSTHQGANCTMCGGDMLYKCVNCGGTGEERRKSHRDWD